MDLKLRLQRMLQILEDVERAGVMSDLEKDMILADLREAYSEVKFGVVLSENNAPAQTEPEAEEIGEPEMEVELVFAEEDDAEVPTESEPEVESEVEPKSEVEAETPAEEPAEEPSVAPVVAPIAAAAVATATVAEAVATEVAAPIVEAVAESVVEVAAEPIAEPIVETVVEPVVEPIVEKPIEAETPAMDDELSIVNSQLSANKPHRNAILSLYDDAPAVVGEQFRDNSTSVADMIASSAKSVASVAPIASLHGAIGVADKFMLVQELFGGDDAAYNAAINALDSLPSFDDCVIFISENYAWSPNSDGTKFMMELLQRKYNA